MSFKFSWPLQTEDFTSRIKQIISQALEGSSGMNNIVGGTRLTYFVLGTQAPELEIIDIAELTDDKLRGLFKFKYSGDAQVEVEAQVQLNYLPRDLSPVKIKPFSTISLANEGFVVPIRIKIKSVALSGVFFLAVDKFRGVTLTFKDDPLESLDIDTNFDYIVTIKHYIQRQIKAQIRRAIQEDLPEFIHNYVNPQMILSEGKDTIESISSAKTCKSGLRKQGDVADSERSKQNSEMFKSLVNRPGYEKWSENANADQSDIAWIKGYTHHLNIESKLNPLKNGLMSIDTVSHIFNNHITRRKIRCASVTIPPSLSIRDMLSSPLRSRINDKRFDILNTLGCYVQKDTCISKSTKTSSTSRYLVSLSDKRKSTLCSPARWENTVVGETYTSQRVSRSRFSSFLRNTLEKIRDAPASSSSSEDIKYMSIFPVVHKRLPKNNLVHMKNICQISNTFSIFPHINAKSKVHITLHQDLPKKTGALSIAKTILMNLNRSELSGSSSTQLAFSEDNLTYKYPSSDPNAKKELEEYIAKQKIHTHNPSKGKNTMVTGKSTIKLPFKPPSSLKLKGLYQRWIDLGYDPSSESICFPKRKRKHRKNEIGTTSSI